MFCRFFDDLIRGFMMIDQLPISQQCLFNTERLSIERIKSQVLDEKESNLLTVKVLELLTPVVTYSLPSEWQNITRLEDANIWLQQRIEASSFFVIRLRSSNDIIGFMFLYGEDEELKLLDLHIGYLLGEVYWGKGYGSELIKGLVDWAYLDEHIHSLVGGVEVANVGSIKVMEKNGFCLSTLKGPAEDVIFLEYVFNRLLY
jgi:RimJ/RimL family protein N-acetyltransferase